MFDLKLSFLEDEQHKKFNDFINNYMPQNYPQVKFSVKEEWEDVGPYYKIKSDKVYNIFDLGFFWGLYGVSNNKNRYTNKTSKLRLVKK
jgi:hypothetical protein